MFFQFSLYACVRVAHHGFTFGELGLVAFGATVLFMELVNLTKAKVRARRSVRRHRHRIPITLSDVRFVWRRQTPTTGAVLVAYLALAVFTGTRSHPSPDWSLVGAF